MKRVLLFLSANPAAVLVLSGTVRRPGVDRSVSTGGLELGTSTVFSFAVRPRQRAAAGTRATSS